MSFIIIIIYKQFVQYSIVPYLSLLITFVLLDVLLYSGLGLVRELLIHHSGCLPIATIVDMQNC